MDWEQFSQKAQSLGFELCGVSSADPYRHGERFLDWLQSGRHADMAYLERDPQRRMDPRQILPEAQSVVSFWLRYDPGPLPPKPTDTLRGQVARYALGLDYHDLIPPRLRELAANLGDPLARAYTDSGPLLERSAAEAAGLGWIGKNSCLINAKHGSYGFLAEIVTAVELPLSETPHPARCGTCTSCMTACPTGAIVAPGVVDSRRCLTYWTIEHRGAIPREIRPLMGTWVFGCDICQEACPWNGKPRATTVPQLALQVERLYPDLLVWLALTPEDFARRFKGSPMKRAKRQGLARNAAIALGNLKDASAVEGLCSALMNDPDPSVQGAAAWALGQIGGPEARQVLERAESSSPEVQEELRAALSELGQR